MKEMNDPHKQERLARFISRYLQTWANLKGLQPPTEDLVLLYVRILGENYSLAEIQEACDYSFERYKSLRNFLAPSEIKDLIEENRRATPGAVHGPMKVSDANFKMLELFLQAFRESGLKGKELEVHLKQVVEDNYDKLGCKGPVINCLRCKDKGFVRFWFLVEKGLVDKHQKDADGKWRTYKENVRVTNAPQWEQEEKPDFDPPAGQNLVDGICRCECEAGKQFSFPKLPEEVPF